MADNILMADVKKEFKCGQCAMSFEYQGDLHNHEKGAHGNARPHKCDKCDYAATIEKNLKRHIMTVHDKMRIVRKIAKNMDV